MEFIQSIHGKKPLLVFDGYIYREHSTLKNGTKRYRCTKEKQCKAFATLNGIDLKITVEHNHLPEPEKIAAKKILNNIKERATCTMEKPRQIVVQSCKDHLTDEVAVSLPKPDAVRQTISYNRKKTLGITKTNPFNRQDILLPEITTDKGELFLFFDSGMEEDRIIVFATTRNLDQMRDYHDWQLDGTFKVCPQLFYQLFTIHIH